MVFARTSKAASRLSEAIKVHDFHKSYLAVVEGKLDKTGVFEDYLKKFPNHDIYTLMLKGATNIHKVESKKGYHSLVFGNESSGLPDEYLDYGKSIFIPHSHYIDSLNLSMALGMTLMHFSKDEFKDKEVL